MKSKTVILMVVAIACGLAASYLTSRVIADRSEEKEVEKVAVLVAKKNVSMGTLLKEPEKFFEEKQFTKGEEPKRALRNMEDLKGHRLNKSLTAEQFVTAEDLIDKEKDLPLEKGMRAVALNVNAQSMVGGFVLPLSHVDIVSVIPETNGETKSRTILQNILVLAVDQIASRDNEKTAYVANTVTVQVTPEQAQQLALAQRLGTIQLSLRSFDDDKKVQTQTVSNKDILNPRSDGNKADDDILMSGDETSKPKPYRPAVPTVPDVPPTPTTAAVVEAAKPVEAPPKVYTMTIYNGQTATKAIFNLGKEGENDSTRVEKAQPDAAAPKPPQQPAAAPKQ
jgi:pilus assembly protein CpaB